MHTILLVQFGPRKSTRTFMDYSDQAKAMDGVCAMFEKYLRENNPSLPKITYDVRALFLWLDSLADLSALVYDAKNNAYIPYNKEWVKATALRHLKGQAVDNSTG
eukprot:jgi/Botrbrau1/20710/Bobra.0058s0039.1